MPFFQEFEKHPFFMQKTPEEGDELSPLMQGLQQLKYDPLENTPQGKNLKVANLHFEQIRFRIGYCI